jgi:hypothetical protein
VIQIKCYPLVNNRYLSIILTKATYPSDPDNTQITSYVYDYVNKKEYKLSTAISDDGIDFSTSEDGLDDIVEYANAETDMDKFEVIGFFPYEEDEDNVYFIKVTYKKNTQNKVYTDWVTRFHDGTYELYDWDELYLEPYSSLFIETSPKLFWETN